MLLAKEAVDILSFVNGPACGLGHVAGAFCHGRWFMRR